MYNVLVFSLVIIVFAQNIWAEDKGAQALSVEPRASINVVVDKIAQGKGDLFVHIYNSEEGYPDKPEKAFKKIVVTPNAEPMKVKIDILEPGEYAIALCHDVNNNKVCDTNFIGIPKEPVGVSNNAKGFMGPPKYKDAKFKLESTDIELNIKVK